MLGVLWTGNSSQQMQAALDKVKGLAASGHLGMSATGLLGHIPNLAVGGVQNAINLDSMANMNMDWLYMLKYLQDAVIPFVQECYFNDACTLAALSC